MSLNGLHQRENPLLQLNIPQQAFTLFYAINWGTAANSQPRWKAFAWGAIAKDPASLRRAFLSAFLLTLIPLAYFVCILWALDRPTWGDLNQWNWSTSLKVFVSILPALAPFGFYRIWISLVEKWANFFYGPLPTIQVKDGKTEEIRSQVWREIGITLTLENDLNSKWARGNFVWGLGYVILGPTVILTALFLQRASPQLAAFVFLLHRLSGSVNMVVKVVLLLVHWIGQFAFWVFATVATLAIQHRWLGRKYRKEGSIHLWYLPDFGFRLVMRNIPGRYLLKDFKFKVRLRKIVPPSKGSSVSTYVDIDVHQGEELFIAPKQDGVLLCFQLDTQEVENEERFVLIVTTKDGKEIKRYDITDESCMIAEYTATVVNPYGLDFKLARRAIASVDMLLTYSSRSLDEERERSFRIVQTKLAGIQT
jgi:hypothetical protein